MKTAANHSSIILPSNERANYQSASDRAHRAAFFAVGALAGDVACVCAGVILGFWVRFFSGLPNEMNYETFILGLHDYSLLMIEGAGVMAALLISRGAYDLNKLVRFREASREVVYSVAIWLVGFLSLALILKLNPPVSRLFVFFAGLASMALLLAWRYAFTRYIRTDSVANVLRQRVLIVGWNAHATQLADAISADPAPQFELTGCVTSHKGSFDEPPPPGIGRLGSMEAIEHIIQNKNIDIVVSVDMDPRTGDMMELSTICERHMVQFKIVPSFFRVLLTGLKIESVDGVPVLGMGRLPLQQPLNRAAKRLADLVGGIAGLIMTAPLIAVFAYLVYRESPGPVFYTQVRTGRDGRLFRIVKIRSMRLDSETSGVGWTTENDPRRLKIGSLMRKLNIDELPQFWNVIKGEMSLVGPRPERPELIRQFRDTIPHYNARHFVKPGITGWAQVNGFRGNTDLTKRILHDLYYMERWSLWLDFLILARTLRASKNAY